MSRWCCFLYLMLVMSAGLISSAPLPAEEAVASAPVAGDAGQVATTRTHHKKHGFGGGLYGAGLGLGYPSLGYGFGLPSYPLGLGYGFGSYPLYGGFGYPSLGYGYGLGGFGGGFGYPGYGGFGF